MLLSLVAYVPFDIGAAAQTESISAAQQEERSLIERSGAAFGECIEMSASDFKPPSVRTEKLSVNGSI